MSGVPTTDRAQSAWSFSPIADAPDTWWREWDRLNDAGFDAHPLLQAQFVRPIVAEEGQRAFAATLRRGDTNVLQTIVAPAGRGRWSILAPSQVPITLAVFERARVGEDVLATLLRALPGFALVLQVSYQDSQFPLPLGAAIPVDRQGLGDTMAACEATGFEAYWAGRSRDLKQNVRRYLKRAEQEGKPARCDVIRDAAAIGAAVDRFGMLESAGWKGKEGTALHPSNAQGRFYRGVMEAYAREGHATAFELHLGDELAASRLMISGRRMHVMLKTTYSEALHKLAPGRLLLHAALGEVLERRDGLPVEFYTRASRDQLQWSTAARPMENVTVYRFGWLLALLRAKRALFARGAAPADAAQAEGQTKD